MIEDALYALLSNDPAVSALVGDRIYPLRYPQEGTLPAIVYTVLISEPEHSLSGRSGLSTTNVEIECYASDFGTVCSLAQAVVNRLTAHRGSSGGYAVHFVRCLNAGTDLDISEPTDPRIYLRSTEFEIQHETDMTTAQ